MSSSSLFDLPLDGDARARLAELAAEGCTLSSTTDRETIEERDPCEEPLICWGACSACSAEPRRIERERTRITAFKGDTLVWEMWV